MAMRDVDDIQNRFKFASKSARPTFINDFQSAQKRAFNVGGSLPPRPRMAAAPSATAAAPAISQSVPLSRPLPQSTPLRMPGQRIKKRSLLRRVLTRKHIILTVVFIILAIGGWTGWNAVRNTLSVFHGNIFSILTTTKLKGEDTGRVNILLAGNSSDDPGHDGANLTDSIMIVSLDTKHNTAFMMSIPRDLWVDIPGYGHAKINEAYVDGQTGQFSAPGFPNGGMGLLEEVVEQDFGIPIDYYGLVDYSALRDSVNAVGGVDINIQSSDPRGLYDPSIDYATHGPLVKLSNGWHHLDGEQALDLARARGDAYGSYGFLQSDFERTQNQRLIIEAIKTKAMSVGVLANPISLSNLFDSIGKNVQTDLTLSDARRMYDLGKSLNNSQIQSVGLNAANGKNLLANYAAPNGESTLIPAAGIDDYSQIQQFIRQLTSNNPVVQEGATVVVLNGTNTSGLAAKAQTALANKDITVSAIGDTAQTATATSIIDASGGKKPATLALLKTLYGSNVTITDPYAGAYTADFIVVLGPDQVQTATTTGSGQ